ncbi:MAG: hypothetical protein ACREBJ_09605 [Nitrosotalea sp.]
MKKQSLLGFKTGYLVVIDKAESKRAPGGQLQTRWTCKCDCGKEIICYASDLRKRQNMSCGCHVPNNTKHDGKKSSALLIFKNSYNDGDISFEEFLELSQMNCHYCGAPTSNKYIRERKYFSQGEFVYNGLDRVDSLRAHNKNNVVPCCKQCNWAKRDFTYDEFLQWIKRIFVFQKLSIT